MTGETRMSPVEINRTMHLTQCSRKFRLRQQNEWRLPVDRPYSGTWSCRVNDARRQRHSPIYGSVKKAFNSATIMSL